MTERRPYGEAVKLASQMASRNATVEQIRACLKQQGVNDVPAVIRTLRARGELPPKVVKRPRVLLLQVPASMSSALLDLSNYYASRRTEVARQAMQIGLRQMQREAAQT